MNTYERISRIAELLQVTGGKITGRKRLHKLVYLLQVKGVDFDQVYKFHHFGVFSSSLARDLDIARTYRLIEQSQESEFGFTIKLIDNEILESSTKAMLEEKKKLAKLLVKESPQILEALSTIVYLSRMEYSGTKLKKKFLELKPNLGRQYGKAKKLGGVHFEIL